MLSYRKLAMRVLGRPLHTGGGNDSPRPASQRAAAFVLTAALLTGAAFPAFAGTYYIEDGDIVISAGTEAGTNKVEQTGKDTVDNDKDTVITNHDKDTASSNTVTIDAKDKDDKVEVTLDNVNIKADSGSAITSKGDVTLTLKGDNSLTGGISDNGSYGLRGISSNGSLTITGGETDSLTAQGGSGTYDGGSGIYSNSLTISGGTVNATGGKSGAGIHSGSFTIYGGTVNAKGGNGGNVSGFGIISDGGVTISGGTVKAAGGDSKDGYGGDGIRSGGVVTISGNTVNAAGGNGGKVGGYGICSFDRVAISGGTVEAAGGNGSTGGGSSSGHSTRYTLHYESNGGTAYKDERYSSGTKVTLDKTPTRESYTFTGWYADKALTQKITSVTMNSDKTVYAGWEATGVPDKLNGDDHFAYVVGYSDSTVRPNANISRAEVATIFFRLLKSDIRDGNLTADNEFSDVSDGQWHNKAISTMAKLGIVKGRRADRFDPDASITRAEFAAICARFNTKPVENSGSFSDISGHWAKNEIERAAAFGWISGYPDGTFRPDARITRAEAMTMINRVLCRMPQSENDLLDSMVTWPDNKPSDWHYLAVQEATNSHDFDRQGEVGESWTKLTSVPDWTRYQ